MAEDKTKINNTRFDVYRDPVKDAGVDFLPTGYEGSTSEDYTIPSCTIEDVDIAVFDLFDKKIGFSQHESEMHENDQVVVVKRKPYVIYAIGERFALTKKLKPLRDKKSKQLLLPAIAIRRTGITQSNEDMGSMGINQTTGVFTIKRRLHKELDGNYQNLLNKLMLENLNPGNPSSLRTQGSNSSITDPATKEGSYLFDPRLGNNVWEIFTIPQPQFYTASYQVVFWTVQNHHMNDMIQTFLSSQLPQGKMFRLNTESGYWFIAHVDEEASSEENYEEFTEEKRLVRYSFRLRVKAFLLAFNGAGVPVPVRRTISAAEISFGLSTAPSLVLSEQEAKTIPLEPKDPYLLSELGEDPNTAQAKTITQKLSVEEQVVDSVTGEVKTRRVKILDTNQKSGETVYYSSNVRNLEELAETLGYKPI